MSRGKAEVVARYGEGRGLAMKRCLYGSVKLVCVCMGEYESRERKNGWGRCGCQEGKLKW